MQLVAARCKASPSSKMILTNGDPREVLQPFNFGQVSQITFAQARALQQMVQQATGAVDSAGIAGQVNESTAAVLVCLLALLLSVISHPY